MGPHLELDIPLLARAPDTFDRGPFSRLFDSRVAGRGPARQEGRRAALAALIAWMPPWLLSLGGGSDSLAPDGLRLDLDAARYLIALPLMIVGLRLLTRRLNAIVDVLSDGGYIGGAETHRMDRLLDSTRRLLAHPAVAVGIVAGAFGVSLATTWTHQTPSARSSADLWRSLVSQPLFLACLGNWLWRTMVWARLVWRVSTYRLRLLPTHPDQAGGLLFVSSSIPAFVPFALAAGTVATASLRDSMILQHRVATEHVGLMLALAAGVSAMAVGPLLPLAIPIRRARGRGMIEYGALANQVGRCFEHHWLRRDVLAVDALASPEFSATTDLYSIAANVARVRMFPVELRALVVLLLAAFAPFVPVALLTVPPDRLLHFAWSLVR